MKNLYKPGDIVLVENNFTGTEDNFLVLGKYVKWHLCAEFLSAAPVNGLYIKVGDSYAFLNNIVVLPERSISENIGRISDTELEDVKHVIRQMFGQ